MTTSRPILFSTPMVQALLEGRKTQTRRMCKVEWEYNGEQHLHFRDKYGKPMAPVSYRDINEKLIPAENFCPYGAIGDLLWVRETFEPIFEENDEGAEVLFSHYNYKADGDEKYKKWKPSIFMPKDASRITLEITNIRVERLQDISAEDAIAEGIDIAPPSMAYGDIPRPLHYNQMNDEEKEKAAHEAAKHSYMARCVDVNNQIQGYKELWQSINGTGSWVLNPWVWVIEFKVHLKKVG